MLGVFSFTCSKLELDLSRRRSTEILTDLQINQFYSDLLKCMKDGGDAVCCRYFDETQTYRDLYAVMLKFNGVLSGFAGRTVVLYAGKSFPTYAAIFSIILSKNVWIPLSPDNPHPRNLEVLEQIKPEIFLHEGKILPEPLHEFCDKNGIETRSFDDVLSGNGGAPFEVSAFNKDDVAYIMFTSGSTGTPKGVPMTHENYINFVINALDILPFGENEVFADFHDFAFDISIFYLFCFPFVRGAISPIREERDRVIPIDHIVKNGVTVWASVPSVINRIRMFRPIGKVETPIRIMFLCGEPLKFDVLRYCFDNMDLKNVYNFYGLTETGVENFFHLCKPEDLKKYEKYGMAPIGTPLPGNPVKITDGKELWIGGCQVTPGYLGGRSPEKFQVFDGVRYCKTGDIAEEYDGVYFCKGRMDSQVKLSGHRVDLMDIEAHIAGQEGVSQVVCFVDEKDGRSTLVAAIKPGGVVDFKKIQGTLQKELPAYMIPKVHMIVEDFPLNNNGKVDRKEIQGKYRKI